MRYVFHAEITAIEKKRRALSAHKIGDEIKVEYEDLGWFAHIKPFATSISLGDAEPPWKPGQKITMTIEDTRE